MNFTEPPPPGQSPAPAEPLLFVHVGNAPPVSLTPDELDAAHVADLADRIANAAGPSVARVVDLHLWPDRPRWDLLQLVNGVKPRLALNVRGKTFQDPFHAVLAAMVGPEDLASHDRSFKVAVEAAAVFHPDVAESAARRINERLVLVGASRINARTLAGMVRRLSVDGPGEKPPPVVALQAARDFVRAAGAGDACDITADFDLDVDAGADGDAGDGNEPGDGSEPGDGNEPGGGGATDDLPGLLYFRSGFFRWGGRAWRAVGDDLLRAQVAQFLQDRGAAEVRSVLVQDVVTNLHGLAALDAWDADPPFHIGSFRPAVVARRQRVVFDNGMIDLDAVMAQALAQEAGRRPPPPRLLAHDRRYFNTIALPFPYDPSARCPRFAAFLRRVLPRESPEDRRRRVLQEFAGYCLLRDCRFETMLVLVGAGRNGKSTFLRVLADMLGRENVTHIPFDQLGQEFRLYDLATAAANISSELSHLGRANEGLLKQLISGEPITSNRKFKPPVTIRSAAKLLVACNDLPAFVDPTDGIWRRLIAMKWEVTIPDDEVDRALASTLAAELPGVFDWALAGLRRLVRQGRFTGCEHCAATLAEHRRASDSAAEFAAACCGRRPAGADGGHGLHGDALYQLYVYFCVQQGRRPVHATQFGARLKRMGFEKRRGRAGSDGSRPWAFAGVGLTGDGEGWLRRLIADRNSQSRPPLGPLPVELPAVATPDAAGRGEVGATGEAEAEEEGPAA